MHINQLIIASLKSEARESELRELDQWRRSSPENERHYQEFVALWNLTEGADDVAACPPPAVAGLIRRAPQAGGDVVHLRTATAADHSAARRSRRAARWRLPAAAAAAVLVVGAGIWALAPVSGSDAPTGLAGGADEFVTGASEAATVELRDGSVVRLAPNSRLLLSGSSGQREVAMNGRAYFIVAPDASKPFRIRTQSGTVTVMGTRFDLQSDGDSLRLVVVDGRVALAAGESQVEVAAGEMSRVEAGALIPAVPVPDVDAAVDWLGTFLAFQATPLSRAAVEIGRAYGVHVNVADESLARRTVTGWFADQGLEQVLRVVCPVVAARCTVDRDVVRIEPLPADPGDSRIRAN